MDCVCCAFGLLDLEIPTAPSFAWSLRFFWSSPKGFVEVRGSVEVLFLFPRVSTTVRALQGKDESREGGMACQASVPRVAPGVAFSFSFAGDPTRRQKITKKKRGRRDGV